MPVTRASVGLTAGGSPQAPCSTGSVPGRQCSPGTPASPRAELLESGLPFLMRRAWSQAQFLPSPPLCPDSGMGTTPRVSWVDGYLVNVAYALNNIRERAYG